MEPPAVFLVQHFPLTCLAQEPPNPQPSVAASLCVWKKVPFLCPPINHLQFSFLMFASLSFSFWCKWLGINAINTLQHSLSRTACDKDKCHIKSFLLGGNYVPLFWMAAKVQGSMTQRHLLPLLVQSFQVAFLLVRIPRKVSICFEHKDKQPSPS